MNFNYNVDVPTKRTRRHHSDEDYEERPRHHSRHSRSNRRSYDDYRGYSSSRYNRWDDYGLQNLDAHVDLSKNIVAPESNTLEPTFGELLNGVSNTDFYLIMSMATIMIMAWVFFTYKALKNVLAKPTITKKDKSATQSTDLVEKLFV